MSTNNDLLALGRGRRRERRHDPAAFAPRRRERLDIRRRGQKKRVHFDVSEDEQGEKGFFERMRSNPLYVPIVFVSLGGLLGACLVNWYYVKYPPAKVDQKDRRERTAMSAAVGAIVGLFVYFYYYHRKPQQREYNENAGYDDDDSDFSF